MARGSEEGAQQGTSEAPDRRMNTEEGAQQGTSEAPDRSMSSPADARGHRSHPATPLVRAWLWLLAAAAWGASSFVRGEDSLTVIGVVLLGAVVLGLGAGYVAWAFTYFVIDGTELRIDSGVFVKRSRRMPYERIQSIDIAQPFGARILGLAELRIEMAGGEESRTQLQFLSLAEARRLRRTLLERSSTQSQDSTTGPTVESARNPAPDATGDPTTAPEGDGPHEAVVQVPLGRLLVASGSRKALTLRAALRAGVATDLVIDAVTATALLALR